MIPSIQLLEDMELKPNPKLIHITTLITNLMRPHLGQATLILREDQAKFIEIETHVQNSQVRRLLTSMNTSRIKQICMDQDNP